MSHSIVFDAENHKYYWNGFAVPCVSEILDDNGFGFDKSKFSEDIIDRIEYKALVGTEVHRATEMIDEGNLNWDSVPSELMPYLDAYNNFIIEKKPIIHKTEHIVFDNEEGICYVGTLDRVFEIENESFVLDIKTSDPQRFHRLQTMAYAMAFTEMKCFRAGLYLTDLGNYRFKEYTEDAIDESIWLNCVENFYFKHPRYRSKKQPEQLQDWN